MPVLEHSHHHTFMRDTQTALLRTEPFHGHMHCALLVSRNVFLSPDNIHSLLRHHVLILQPCSFSVVFLLHNINYLPKQRALPPDACLAHSVVYMRNSHRHHLCPLVTRRNTAVHQRISLQQHFRLTQWQAAPACIHSHSVPHRVCTSDTADSPHRLTPHKAI